MVGTVHRRMFRASCVDTGARRKQARGTGPPDERVRSERELRQPGGDSNASSASGFSSASRFVTFRPWMAARTANSETLPVLGARNVPNLNDPIGNVTGRGAGAKTGADPADQGVVEECRPPVVARTARFAYRPCHSCSTTTLSAISSMRSSCR